MASIHVEKPKSVSIVLSTYNAPKWLEKSLWGFLTQIKKPDEIVIADDGSDDRTAAIINQIQSATKIKIHHVWHEDDGFQKCAILNRAIEEASGDYLIFSDGDCIPRNDFILEHYRHATKSCYLSGGYNKLPLPLSRQITTSHIRSGIIFQPAWLRANGLPINRQLLRLITKGRVADLCNRMTTTNPTWNGHNASGWKTDLLRTNGFDERMRYGGEDCELGDRLVNSGIRPIQIRFSALCLHLEHARGYVNESDKKRNLEIRKRTQRNGIRLTQHGIVQNSRKAA